MIETNPPATLGPDEVVVLQPYGSLFFAAAPVFETLLPTIDAGSRNSVVILRPRGRTDLGTTFMDVFLRYARSLAAVDSKLVLVSTNGRIDERLGVTGIIGVIGTHYRLTRGEVSTRGCDAGRDGDRRWAISRQRPGRGNATPHWRIG